MTLVPSLPAAPFFFMRHGETDWNRRRLCVGQADRRLTGRGRDQALAARAAVSRLGIALIVHSPLSRAAETASIVSQGLACDVLCEDDLREACLGVKEGMPEDDPDDDFIARWLAGGFISGAERFEQLKERVARAVQRSIAQADRGPVLLISHWGVFAAISALAGRRVGDPDHCVPYRVAPTDGGWRIARSARRKARSVSGSSKRLRKAAIGR